MVKVFFQTENGSYSEEIASFKDEDLYMKCKIALVLEAKKSNMILTESIEVDEVENAKETLKEKGYQTANLWHIKDVQSRFKCSDEEAMEVIESAMVNEATKNQIWFAIDLHARELGLTLKKI